MGKSKEIYSGYAEESMEDYMQDLLFSQAGEYDKERELLSQYAQPLRQQKRLFSKHKFKNRRNSFRFAKQYSPHLPF